MRIFVPKRFKTASKRKYKSAYIRRKLEACASSEEIERFLTRLLQMRDKDKPGSLWITKGDLNEISSLVRGRLFALRSGRKYLGTLKFLRSLHKQPESRKVKRNWLAKKTVSSSS